MLAWDTVWTFKRANLGHSITSYPKATLFGVVLLEPFVGSFRGCEYLEVIGIVRLGVAYRHKSRLFSFVSLQLPLAPMSLFAIGIEHPLDMSIERPHHADQRHHRRPVLFGDQDQAFHRCLPFSGGRIFL